MKTGELGIKLIQYFEGLHDGNLSIIGLQPKECPAGIWTIGYGRALMDKKGNWLKGEEGYKQIAILYPELLTITKEEATVFLMEDLKKYEKKVNSYKLALSQNEFDALVSHTYNTGGSDTLFKLIKNKASVREIQDWFTQRYITANGKILPGLVKRRNSEAILFLTGKLTL